MELVEGEPLDRLIPETGLPLERILGHRHDTRRGPRRRPRERHRPPRSEARQRHGDDGRARQGPRLRPRQGRGLGRRRPGRLRAAHRDADPRGRRDGDGAVHVTGAGLGPNGGPPERHLLPGRHPLRDGDRAAALRGRIVRRARLVDPARRATAARRAAGRPAGGSGAGDRRLPGEEHRGPGRLGPCPPRDAGRRAQRAAVGPDRSGPGLAPRDHGRLRRDPRRRGLLGRGAAVQVQGRQTPTSRRWPRGCRRRS